MSKRQVLLGCAISAAIALGSAAAPVQAKELKISTFLPPNHTFVKTMEDWAAVLEKETGGALTARVYPASQLGPINRQFDLVKKGIADVAISLHGATPGRFQMAEVASLPLVSPSAGSRSAISSRRLTELAPKYLAKENEGMRMLWMAVTPPLMFHTTKQIKTIEDFKGLRIRYAGQIFAKIIKGLDAVPLAVKPGETTDAVAKGIIDGATFPYEGAQSFDLGTVVKYTLEPGVSSATFGVVMSPATYDSLPDDQKALIDRTTGPDAAQAFGERWDASEGHGKAYMIEKGVEIYKLPSAELARMKKHLEPIIADHLANLESQGLPAGEFFKAYTK